MKPRLHIAIFDGSFKTTPFITRLINGLSEKHMVSVFGFKEDLKQKLPNVRYVALGSSANTLRLMQISLGFAFTLLFRKGDFKHFSGYLSLLFTFRKKQLQQKNLDTTMRLLQPDIFHVQWPSLLPWCETVIEDSQTKVILSQRGYQNNVRPFVNSENLVYLKRIYPKLDGFHSVSETMVSVSNKIYNSPEKIDKVVYSGFDFEMLPFSEKYTKKTPLQIISIGRPHWIKGYDYALKACEILKGKGIKFTYTIIGAAQNEELQYKIDAAALQKEIILTNKISQADVYGAMKASDLLLFPSIQEGLPNVLVEAMALGLPVIATDCGGVSELLNNSTGIVVPTRDASAMAEAVITFLDTPLERIDNQRKNARSKAIAQHPVDKMVADMENLYVEVLNAPATNS